MRIARSFGAIVLIGLLAAACGGAGSPTQGPGGGGGTPTQNPGGGGTPTENPGGGGGGAGNTSKGEAHVEITGPVTKSADYGFIPEASVFGSAQGSSFSFTNEGTNEVLSIVIGADGNVLVSWGTQEFSAPAATCSTSNWNVGATSASGSFDCTAALVIKADGSTGQNATLKGNFTASK